MSGLIDLRALIGLHRVPSSLYLWGDNTYGQLGDSKANTYFSWTTITSGDSHSVAIRSDGTLWAWGDNSFGQLGDGLTANRSSPSQVGTSSWLAVAAGSSHTVGVLTIGTLYTWGGNQFGQLGDSTTVSKSAPAIVGVLSTWTKVTAGGNQSGAINSTSQLYVWGNNNSGQLGLNYSFYNQSSPVQLRASANFLNNSLWFNAGDYIVGLGGLANEAFGFGTGDFTVEYWMYATTFSAIPTIVDLRKAANVNCFSDNFTTGGLPGIYSAATQLAQSTIAVSTSTWTHVAYTRLAGTMKIWVGGAQGASVSNSNNFQTAGYLTIGSNYTNVNPYQGYVTNIRIIKGQALFNDTFTPSTSPLTPTTVGHTGIGAAGSITGTVSLLTGQYSSAYIDSSPNAFSFVSAGAGGGGAIIQAVTPFTIATDPSWVNVSSGKSHMVAIKSDNTLWAWGDNIYGKLGDGSTIARSSAVQIGSSTWSVASAGGTHTAAIESDGSLMTWGLNSSGQLGLNTAYSGSYWTQISEGQYHTLAIRSDGALFVWGRNQYGQLGFGDTVTRSSPVQLGTSSWTAVEAGASHSIAITSDGKLFVWGDNTYGQLGNNPASTNISWSKIAISSSGSHVMALRNDGTLWTWGEGALGRMGDNTAASKSSPIQVGSLNTWIGIGVGDAGAAAISSIDNALWVWGSGTSGVIGDGSAGQARSSPGFVGSNFKKVTGGVTIFTAIDNNNYGYVWGSGSNGALANNRTDISYSSPVLINSVDTWSSFSASSHVLGIKTDGTLWAWGTNIGGELGLGDTLSRSSPVQVGTSTWLAVSAGGSFSVAIRSDGGLFTWGRNSSGQLGHTDVGANGNSATILRSSPVQIGLSPSGVTGYVSWSAIATGNEHTLAIQQDGTLWGWGTNSVGQLGNGLVTSRSSPVQIGTSTWSQIQAGTSFSCGLASDGKLYTWGLNNAGALGDGTTANKSNPTQIGTTTPSLSSPVQIASDKSWSAIGAGEGHSLAITNLGALWSWGRNDQGQLGDTTKVYKSSPVQINSGTSYVAVYAGGTHSVALKSDYTMYAWGYNVSGQVGDTSVVSRSAPVQIGASSWIQITAGKDHSAAIKFDNTLWTWGLNSKGQLGDSTTVTKSSPVSVAGLWLEVEAGASHTAAIANNSTLFVFGDDRYGQ